MKIITVIDDAEVNNEIHHLLMGKVSNYVQNHKGINDLIDKAVGQEIAKTVNERIDKMNESTWNGTKLENIIKSTVESIITKQVNTIINSRTVAQSIVNEIKKQITTLLQVDENLKAVKMVVEEEQKKG